MSEQLFISNKKFISKATCMSFPLVGNLSEKEGFRTSQNDRNKTSECLFTYELSNMFRFMGTLIIFFLLSTNVLAAEETQRIKGPITITSDRLTADNQAHTALFENSVIARTTDMTIYADRMLVYYDKDTGSVTKIDAVGGVKLIRENRVITSKEATYYADEEKVIFTGEPKAVEGENVVTGSKMTYLMNEDRFLVEGSKVFLINRKSAEAGKKKQ